MDQRPFEFSVKTIAIGDSSVGKSSLLARFTRDAFDAMARPTLGVEFLARRLDTPKRHHIELQLWDTAGQEMFRTVTRGYYRGASVVYLVFDLANRASFDALDRWIRDAKDIIQTDVIFVLIGNKSDLVAERAVGQKDARQFATEQQMKYFEVSAKTGDNVAKAMTSILGDIDILADHGKFRTEDPLGSIVHDIDDTNTKRCC
jgi:small GTP-binding protein